MREAATAIKLEASQGHIDLSQIPLSAFPNVLLEYDSISWLALDGAQFSDGDIRQISKMNALTWLQIKNAPELDYAPLSALEHLTTLRMTGQVSDISFLRELNQLQDLQLGATRVVDISTVSELTDLRGLLLNFTDVVDLSPIQNLTNLEYLSIAHTKINDISAVSGLEVLQNFAAWESQVADASPLAGLPKLEFVDLRQTPLASVSGLGDLPRLRILNISHTQVKSVKDVVRSSNLSVLDVSGVVLDDESELAPLIALGVRVILYSD